MWSYVKLILWGMAWCVLWITFQPWRKERNNCLTWAVDKWNKDGGYLVIRWCRHTTLSWIVWPHFLWLDEKYHIYLEHVVPVEGDNPDHLLPSAWFEEKHMVGDPEDVVEN